MHYSNCREGGLRYDECAMKRGCFWDNTKCDFINETTYNNIFAYSRGISFVAISMWRWLSGCGTAQKL